MDRNDVRIAAVLRELADLGRRIGERAGELATLTMERHRASSRPPDDGVTSVAAAAAHLATDAAAVAAVGSSTEVRRAGAGHPRPTTGDIAESSPASRRAPKGGHGQGRPGQRATDRGSSRPAHGEPRRRSRQDPVVRPTPSGSGRRGRSKRAVGPMFVSGIVHVIVLLALAMIFVAVDAKPVPVALTLGMAAEPAFDEAALVSIDVPQEPDEPSEQMLMAEAVALEPLPLLDMSLSEGLLADSQPADDAGGDAGGDAMASLDPGAMLADIGGAGKGEAAGGGRGEGAAAGRPATTFFGRPGQARSVCFICDNSNSHRDGSFHAVLEELARAVDSLRPEQSFFVIFASDAAYPLFHPASADELQPATMENKRKLRAWLGTVEMCRGGQGIHDAAKLAGALGAEVVYLLSDGELGGNVVGRLEAADFGGAAVHTFGMQQTILDKKTGQVDPDKFREQQGHDRNLSAIARAHGGTFTPVVVPPAAAALERLRPIPRNRSRGAVWGLRL